MMQFGMPTLIENRTFEDNVKLCKVKLYNIVTFCYNILQLRFNKKGVSF